jgi:O-antigen biosynthesis protein
VLLSRPDVADAWLPNLRRHTGARILYYGVDLHFHRMRLQGEVMRDDAMLRAADRMEELERAIWRGADAVLYLSEEEAAVVRTMEPGVAAHAVVPYCFDRFGTERPAPQSHQIIFVAGFGHPPNAEGVCWFVREVLPLIREQVRDAALAIVGSNPTEQVRALAGGAVTVHANVSSAELLSWYERARVSVVPLRCGAGVKLKVVEALRDGLPLVTTEVGAQGLPGLAEIVPIESDPLRFAEAVCALLVDDQRWQQQSAAQRRYASARFRTEALSSSLLQACGMAKAIPLAA